MKKILIFLFSVLLIARASGEETFNLRLRANNHPDFLRIVIEGTKPSISRAIVNQTGEDILVKFPYSRFLIEKATGPLRYKVQEDTIVFSLGDFNKFKVFTLDYPSRLVLDIYLNEFKKNTPSIPYQSTQGQIRRIATVTTFVIDPGHGGFNHGITRGEYREKNVVLDIARKLKALINRSSARCLLTRESDQFMPLKERIKFTNKNSAEIFLSVHIGNHGEIVLYTPVISDTFALSGGKYLFKSGLDKELADKMSALRDTLQTVLTEDFGDDTVITKSIPYSILSKIEAASLIIELPSFEDTPYDEKFKTDIANSIYRGLYRYEENTAY
jgi:N-acetylmuramoyl-L-alanine amidase